MPGRRQFLPLLLPTICPAGAVTVSLRRLDARPLVPLFVLLSGLCYHSHMLPIHCAPDKLPSRTRGPSHIQGKRSGLRFCLCLCIFMALLTACLPVVLAPTPTPTAIPTPSVTFTPSPTLLPSPTPTATPIPPLKVTVHWPEQVSALQPVPVEVELIPPPGVSVTATARAIVFDPRGLPYHQFDLMPGQGNMYVAEEPLRLPLEPRVRDPDLAEEPPESTDGSPERNWHLVVSVRSTLAVEGERTLSFRPTPVLFWNLDGVLPAGVDVRVPRDFVEVASQGDPRAGNRAWRYGGGELSLWWAPGPVEPLLLSNAIVMLEATRGPGELSPDARPTSALSDVEETDWQGQTAFLFRESLPGSEGGPVESLVVQGPDYWLYVLQVRALGGESIPPLLRQVGETLTFVEE